MKKWSILLLCILIFTACDNKEDVPKYQKEQAPITVWAYLLADAQNIEEDIVNNILTMYLGLAKMDKPADLLIYWDSSDGYRGIWKNPVILKYSTDGEGNINGKRALDYTVSVSDVVKEATIIKEYPTHISTEKEVVKNVLQEMKKNTTTNKIGLIAGSHGSAWLKSIDGSRSFGQDKKSDYTILIPDMADVMKSLNLNLDFLLFDACMMCSAEVCYEFKDVVNYMLASVQEIPSMGFPYDEMLTLLYEGNLDGYKLACENYIEYYNEEELWGTISVIDCKQMENLASMIKEVVSGNRTTLENDYSPFDIQDYGANSTYDYIMFDIMHFIHALYNNEVPSEYTTQFKETVLYTNNVTNIGSIYSKYQIEESNYCGLGMYIPVKERKHWNTYFKTIGWYRAAGWDNISFSWGF